MYKIVLLILLFPALCFGNVLPQSGERQQAPEGLRIIETIYEIEYGPVGGPYEISQTRQTQYLQENLEPGTEYEARYRTIINNEPGEWSEWVQVETLEE